MSRPRHDTPEPGERRYGLDYWLDDFRNVKKVIYALFALCGALLLVDLVYHKHGHFAFEEWFGFYGFYGFFGSVGLVLVAKLLRKVLMRGEDYYER